jgi:uncharacterized protein YndB with AHSA1/START domain
MSVKQEANGRRSVAVEFEVPGTPEDVWQALATGPGISAWFVPTDIEERDGKPVAVTYHFGPGMDIQGVVTACERPRLFAQEGQGPFPGSPPIATAWTIEARSGSICTVRIVHSLFASTDEWDNQLEGAAGGWAGFLSILRVYLTHFRGQRSAIMQVSTPVTSTEAEAWETLTAALGVKGVSAGQRWKSPAGVSPLSGVVELLTEDPYDGLLRLDKPGPGIAAIGAQTFPGGPTTVAMNLYLYGDQAAATVARDTPLWEAWFQEHFPMPTAIKST